MKTSLYKTEIIKLLKKNHLLSIGEIHKKIKKADYSTIYRNIQRLLKDEVIVKQVFDKNIVLYEINNKKKHGHFLCNICQKIEKIEMPTNLSVFKKGYSVKEYLLTGLCNKCKINN